MPPTNLGVSIPLLSNKLFTREQQHKNKREELEIRERRTGDQNGKAGEGGGSAPLLSQFCQPMHFFTGAVQSLQIKISLLYYSRSKVQIKSCNLRLSPILSSALFLEVKLPCGGSEPTISWALRAKNIAEYIMLT